MATVQVLEFGQVAPETGEPVYPPIRTSVQTIPGAVRTNPNTVFVSVSTDTDCRMGVDQPATAYGTPVLAVIPFEFCTGGSGPLTLNFI